MAARTEHRSRSLGAERSAAADGLYHRPQDPADHVRERLGNARRITTLAYLPGANDPRANAKAGSRAFVGARVLRLRSKAGDAGAGSKKGFPRRTGRNQKVARSTGRKAEMKALWELLNQPFAHRVAWTLLHSLWQGAFIAGLFGMLRSAMRNSSANARYLAGCLALLLFPVVALLTFFWMSIPSDSAGPAYSAAGAQLHLGSVLPLDSPADAPASDIARTMWGAIETLSPWLVISWSIGVAVCAVQLLQGCWRLKRLCKE